LTLPKGCDNCVSKEICKDTIVAAEMQNNTEETNTCLGFRKNAKRNI